MKIVWNPITKKYVQSFRGPLVVWTSMKEDAKRFNDAALDSFFDVDDAGEERNVCRVEAA